MKKTPILFTLLATCAFFSCEVVPHAYYVSPYNGNHNPYHPIPLKTDSIKSAFYLGGAVSLGSANEELSDKTFTVYTNVSGAHNFGMFQGFYSANLSWGNYKVEHVEPGSSGSGPTNPAIINRSAGNKFFGGAGVDAGVNVVAPMPTGEWRLIGIETSLQKEYGKYLQFRQQLPYNAADFIAKEGFYGTLGLYSEYAWKATHGSGGLRLAYGTVLGHAYRNTRVYDNQRADTLKYEYGTITVHMSVTRKLSFYVQGNVATKTNCAFIGANYKLGK